jgi:XTP/dITP diphosphohydrolase
MQMLSEEDMSKQQWPFNAIVIATGNKHKQAQFVDLFAPLGLTVKGLNDFSDVPDIEEDQPTFEGNAAKKAEMISQWLGGPVIADDSGLVVPALDGLPGVYSARYAGLPSNDAANNEKLLRELSRVGRKEPKAHYVCVMAIAIPEQPTQLFRGECHGNVIATPRGDGGFGYDPLFYLPEEGKTMAELSNERKYTISHRAVATEQLLHWMQEHYRFG